MDLNKFLLWSPLAMVLNSYCAKLHHLKKPGELRSSLQQLQQVQNSEEMTFTTSNAEAFGPCFWHISSISDFPLQIEMRPAS